MGEFFVKSPDMEFLNNSCSILRLPSSITCTHLYGSTSISLVVKALVDFCGMTIGFSSSLMLTWRRVAFGSIDKSIAKSTSKR